MSAFRREPVLQDSDYDGITADRVEDALYLKATDEGGGVYYVTGGKEPHWVNLYDPDAPRCDCGDYLLREVVCKHILRCLMDRGDHRLLVKLRQMRGE